MALPMGSGAVTGAQAAATASDVRPGDQVQNRQYNTTTGKTQGQFGQFKTDDLIGLLMAAENDPKRAAQIWRLANGQSGPQLGFMGAFRNGLYGQAMQAALSLVGSGTPGATDYKAGLPGLSGNGGLEDMANQWLQAANSNDLAGFSNKLGQQALGMDFGGVSSPNMEDILRTALGLQGLSMGSLGGAVQKGRLDNVVNAGWERDLANTGNDQINFADLLNQSKYKNAMQNFGR